MCSTHLVLYLSFEQVWAHCRYFDYSDDKTGSGLDWWGTQCQAQETTLCSPDSVAQELKKKINI